MKEGQYIDISTTAHSFVAFYGKAKITPVTSLEDTLSPPTDTESPTQPPPTNEQMLAYFSTTIVKKLNHKLCKGRRIFFFSLFPIMGLPSQ